MSVAAMGVFRFFFCVLLLVLSSASLAVGTDSDNDGILSMGYYSLGYYHSCAIDDTGVVCWGWNDAGQTDVPSLSNPSQVSLGRAHTCALEDSGVVCWGWNDYGQTDVPSLSNPRQLSLGYQHSCALDDTGVVCWGRNDHGQTNVPLLSNPVQVATGGWHTCALDDSGVVCWGPNWYRQTDVPSLINPTQVSSGDYHSCALDDAGVVCWGWNDDDQTDVPLLSNPTQVSAGGLSCALDDSGVVCWGYNGNGETDVPSLSNPTKVFVGYTHVCATDDTGLVCWGWNPYGQTTVPELSFTTAVDNCPDDETCDFDGDGVSNSYDAFPLDSLYSFDSDADGIPDSWEILYGLNPYDPNDVDIDQDNDGIPSWQEYIDGTFPVSDRTLDIDANGNFDALTDGLIILRYAFGMRGDSLIDGVIANEAMRTTPFNIETFIANLLNINEFESVVLDFDFNGSFDALTDGLIILRYAFGMRGDSLVDGVISEDAMRISATDVEAYIYSLLQLNIVEFKNNNVVITDYINGSFSNPVQHTINGVHDGGTTLVADLVDAKLDYQNLKQILDNDGTGTPLDMSFELSNLPAGSGSTSVNLRIFNGDDVIQDSNEDYLQVALIANWESDGDTIQIELPAYSNLVATFFDRGGTTLSRTITNMSADVITATKQGPNRPHSLEMRLSKLLSAFPSEVNGLSTFLDSSEIFTYQVEFGNFTLYDDLENPFTKIQGTFAVGEAEIAP